VAIAYLGLGSNVGDKKLYLYRAIQALNHQEKISITKLSSLYETEPWGYTDQAVFMNLVIEIETELLAIELLGICQQIEQNLERIREIKWGPRTVDIDILLYGNETMVTNKLKIPHPYLLERDFVVIPLSEIAPNLEIKEKTMSEWAKNFNAQKMKVVSKTIL